MTKKDMLEKVLRKLDEIDGRLKALEERQQTIIVQPAVTPIYPQPQPYIGPWYDGTVWCGSAPALPPGTYVSGALPDVT